MSEQTTQAFIRASVIVSACAAMGLLAAGGWWWYRPRHYVSTSVLRPQTSDPQAVRIAERKLLEDYTLTSIIERRSLYPEARRVSLDEAIRRMREEGIRIQEAESLGPVVVISFEYTDADGAQAVAGDLVEAFQAIGMKCEVMIRASSPMWAKEDQAGVLPLAGAGFGGGLAAGMIAAGVWWMVRIRSQARRGTASLSG
jgi:hypothetical protein